MADSSPGSTPLMLTYADCALQAMKPDPFTAGDTALTPGSAAIIGRKFSELRNSAAR